MAKTATVFVCSDCGEEALKWAGQCPACRAWNTLSEFHPAQQARTRRSQPLTLENLARPITELELGHAQRRPLAWAEVNRVLGGGIVPGSLVLVGGEPGVGKSTLLMHVAQQVAASSATVLYATGEESAQQVRMRAARLGALDPKILVLAENDLEVVVRAIEQTNPGLAIVDSIQTIQDGELEGAAGGISQVKEAAGRLMRVAKGSGVPVILVGHVNKEGAIAGPRVLEHLVDTVLYLEGDRAQEFRILRTTKNRFGSSDEIGIFAMGAGGLEEVADPSAALLSGATLSKPGTVVVATIEGTRPLLVELQSLVIKSSYGLPRRSVTGFDLNRLQMIVAVLEQRALLPLGNADIFVNVAGGIRIGEPAADLALALSVVGNLCNQALPAQTIVLGELGLAGEVRKVSQLGRRLAEAARRGFTRALVPATQKPSELAPLAPSLELVPVADLGQAIMEAFGAGAEARARTPAAAMDQRPER